MRDDIQIQAVKATPAVVGTAWYSLTMQEWVAIATIVYIGAQFLYLIWKWHNEHVDRKNRQ